MSIINKISTIVGKENVIENASMKNYTTFKTGGMADYFVNLTDVNQLKPLIKLCADNDIAYRIHGNGSNVLFSDEGYRGVVICIGSGLSDIRIEGNRLYAMAGASLSRIATAAANESLSGLEFASGIPGTLGGAVVMNAGAYGGEIKDVIVSATVYSDTGDIVTLSKDELCLGYRTSIIEKKAYIVLDATFELNHGDKDDILAKMKDFNQRRRDKQPLEHGSAGSTFKRPEGHFAGSLIEQSGLKGYRVGDAMVSDKHAGFVVNVGNATSNEVLEVIKHVQDTVYERFGVKLETEVKIVGNK